MDVKERIRKYLEYKDISDYRFEKDMSLSKGYLNKAKNPTADVLIKMCGIYTDLSSEWLLRGGGDMIKDEVSNIAMEQDEGKLIPLYRSEAAAGFGTDDFAIKPSDIEGYYKIKEFMNADFMLHVRGDSMFPLYKPGDTVAVREIKECKFIQWGKPHLLAARYQGLLIKRLYPGDREDEVAAVSENSEIYPPFKIPIEEITGIALVIGTVRLDNF